MTASARGSSHAFLANARAKLGPVYRRWRSAGLKALLVPEQRYARYYGAHELHKTFHRLGLPATLQAALVPRLLTLNPRLMQQPYLVRVADIRWGGRPPGGPRRVGWGTGRGLIHAGDWDICDKRPLDEYLADYIYSKTVLQIYRDGLPYAESDQFKEMVQVVRRGIVDWRSRGCGREQDVHRYFAEMERNYRSIQAHGYMSAQQLGNPKWYDEIKLFVDRDGELHKQQGSGHHRLPMARLLGIEKVPVLILGVHRRWAVAAQREFGLDIISSVDMKIRRDIACE